MAFVEKAIKEAPEKLEDDGNRYIFPIDEVAPGSNFSPKSVPVPSVAELTTPVIPQQQALPTQEFINPTQTAQDTQRLPATVAPMAPAAQPITPSIPDNSGDINAVYKAGLSEAAATQAQIDEIQKQKVIEIEKKIKEDEEGVQKIEPKNFFSGKNTWQKILGGVGMFLGSLTPEGAKNIANIIDKEIDRDIDMQKTNIKLKQDKSDTRYKMLLEKYGSQEGALLAKKRDAYTALGLHINKLELASKNAETRARLAQGAQEIELKKQSLGNDLMKLMMDQQKEVMKGAIPGYTGSIQDPTAAREFRKQHSNANAAYSEIANLLKINKQTGSSFSPSARASADQSQALLLGQLREVLVGPGSMSEGDRSLMEDAIANPTKFFSLASSNEIKLNKLKESIQRKVDANAQSYGLVKEMPKDIRGKI